MTWNPQAARASLLAVLMVASVATAGVSVADGATTASVSGAIEYGGSVELALSEGSSVSVSASDVSVWVDGRSRSVTVDRDGSSGRIVLSGLDDVAPHQSLTVAVDAGDLDTGNVSVRVTGTVVRAGADANVFSGAPIAYLASGTDVTFDILREGSFVAARSTGVNSRVFVVGTEGTTPGDRYTLEESDGRQMTTTYTIRDLGLTASVNRTDVPGSGAVEVSISTRGSQRPMVLHLVDAADGEVVRRTVGSVGGDGTGSVTLADLPQGTYRVVVEDSNTGNATETGRLSVGATEEGTVSFATKVTTDQRGDVMDVPLSFEGSAAGSSATVTLGSSDVNFEVAFTVVDDGDGEATIHWNVAESASGDAGISVSGGQLQGSVDVRTGVDRPVVSGEYPMSVSYAGQETSVATAVVEARSTDGLTVYTAPASVSGFDDVDDLRSTVDRSDAVAIDPLTRNDDWVVLELQASGLEGYVDGVGDLTGANGLSLTVVESEETVGANEDPLTVDVGRATLLPAGDEDTYYVAFQPDELAFDADPGDRFDVAFAVSAAENGATTSDQRVSTTFAFANGTASFDTTDGAVRAPPEAGATVTGTSTFAPGTELTVELRSEGGQSPFIQTVEGVTVQADGTWSATADLSEGRAGQTFTATVLKEEKARSSAQGRLDGDAPTTTGTGGDDGDSDGTTATPGDGTSAGTTAPGETDGDTPAAGGGDDAEPTATATSAPGFGVVLALVGLLAGALLVRRD